MSESNALIQPAPEEKFLKKTGDYKKQALEREAFSILGYYGEVLKFLSESFFSLGGNQINQMGREELDALGKILFKKSAWFKFTIALSFFSFCIAKILQAPIIAENRAFQYRHNYKFLVKVLGEDFLSKYRRSINITSSSWEPLIFVIKSPPM